MLIGSFMSLSAQDTTTYQSRRDWFVGLYEGEYIKDDTTNGNWNNGTIEIIYNTNTTVNVTCSFDGYSDNYMICEDSIMGWLWTYPTDSCYGDDNNYGELFPDSTIKYNFVTVGAFQTPVFYYFKGKKIKSYAGTNNNTLNKKPVKLYPNPAINKLNIVSSESIDRIEFYNLSGIKIKTIPLKQNQKEIDVALLPKGLYFYKVYFTNHKFYAGKILLLK